MRKLQLLWTGELPLGEAFWIYAVVGGLAVNLISSLAFLFLILVDWLLAALVVGYGFSVPYNLVALVGVWRAAARHEGEPGHAQWARMVTLIGMIVLTVT